MKLPKRKAWPISTTRGMLGMFLAFGALAVFPELVVAQDFIKLPGNSSVYAYTVREGTAANEIEESRLRFEPGVRLHRGFELVLYSHRIDLIPKGQLPIFQNGRYVRNMNFADSQRSDLKKIQNEFAMQVKQKFDENISDSNGLAPGEQKTITRELVIELEKSRQLAYELLLPHQLETFETTKFQNEYIRRKNRVLLSNAAKENLKLSKQQLKQLESTITDSEKELAELQAVFDSKIEQLKQSVEKRILSKLDPAQRDFIEQKLNSIK